MNNEEAYSSVLHVAFTATAVAVEKAVSVSALFSHIPDHQPEGLAERAEACRAAIRTIGSLPEETQAWMRGRIDAEPETWGSWHATLSRLSLAVRNCIHTSAVLLRASSRADSDGKRARMLLTEMLAATKAWIDEVDRLHRGSFSILYPEEEAEG